MNSPTSRHSATAIHVWPISGNGAKLRLQKQKQVNQLQLLMEKTNAQLLHQMSNLFTHLPTIYTRSNCLLGLH